MKNKFFVFLLTLLFALPLYGVDSPRIVLNGIAYKEVHPLVEKNENLFVSKEDFMLLTYAKIESNQNQTYTIHLGSVRFTLSPHSTEVRIGRETFRLDTTLFIQEETLYIPLEVLDLVGISYQFENNVLSISDVIPYSQNIDRVSSHTFKEAELHLENLPSQLTIFSTEESLLKEIQTAKEDKNYLAFLDRTFQPEVHELLRQRLRTSPYNNIQVILRVPELFEEHSISSFEVLPMTIDVFSKRLDVTIGDTLTPITSLWTTFYPHESMTSVDITKTMDVTLMRTVYEYYRNKYHLRDDTFFSPFTMVTSDRTNTLIHDAYAIENGQEVGYTIRVHRVHPSGTLTFLVDLYRKEYSLE
jgi:hypothetical protein